MSNVVLSTKKPSAFLTVGKPIGIPSFDELTGLARFPPWIHFWPETEHAFAGLNREENGDIVVVPCSCGSGWKHGWDMNPEGLLRFVQEDRSPSNSWLTLGEVAFILFLDRVGSLRKRLPSPFYFIVPGWGKSPHLLEVRRKNQYAYHIHGSGVVSKKSMIPRQKPLFIPAKARHSL
jgi:hypothetical protein